jgi:hypothetical protein
MLSIEEEFTEQRNVTDANEERDVNEVELNET